MKTHRHHLMLLLALLAALLAACGSPDQTPVDSSPSTTQLQLRLKQGDSYRYQVTMEQKVKTAIAEDEELEITTLMGFTYRYEVESVEADGSSRIKMTYEAVSADMQMGGMGGMQFDSTNPEDMQNEQFKSMSTLVGKTISMKLGPDGKASDVQGLEELLGEDEAGAAFFKGMFGEGSSFLSGQNGFGTTYPDKPIAIGDTWTTTNLLGAEVMPMTLETTYTLKERKDGIATLDLQGTIKTKAAPTSTPTSELPLRYELSGTQQGTAQVDESTGLPRHSELTQDVAGTMTMFGLSGNEEGTSAPMSLKTSMTMEQVPCCEALPRSTPRPTPTPLPTPDDQELEQLVRDFGAGSFSDEEPQNVRILGVREIPSGLLVIYSAQTASMISEGLGTPEPDPAPGELVGVLGYLELTSIDGSWRENGGMSSIGGPEKSELLRYGAGSSFTMEGSINFVYGVPRDERVKAIEASFSGGRIVRAESAGPDKAMIAVADDVEDACELRVLGAGDEVLEHIELADGEEERSLCGLPPAPTETPEQ